MSANKIFIIDDDKAMCMLLRNMLSNQGYLIELLHSGVDLLARLQEVTPDLMILDVIMPGMDGFKICRCIKAESAWQHIPIILITALDAKRVLAKGIEAGADDFLQKPVNKWELGARVRSMLRIKHQYDELEATLRLREEFSYMLVHDMSSPITAIHLHAALLEDQLGADQTQAHQEVAAISAAAEQLDSFISDMLMTAKLEQSKLRLNRSKVDVIAITRKIVNDFLVIADSKSIKLALELRNEVITLYLDENLFRRLLANLLSNALKYAPVSSHVQIVIEYHRDQDSPRHCLKIQISDEGEGVPEAYRERIFDKFDVVKLKKQGVRQIGLGLAFCKLVVDAHDGRIYVKDNQPQGAIFVVEI